MRHGSLIKAARYHKSGTNLRDEVRFFSPKHSKKFKDPPNKDKYDLSSIQSTPREWHIVLNRYKDKPSAKPISTKVICKAKGKKWPENN